VHGQMIERHATSRSDESQEWLDRAGDTYTQSLVDLGIEPADDDDYDERIGALEYSVPTVTP